MVVPLFAGYDLRRSVGRLFQYDITSGRYEESDFAATGSGRLHGATVVKLGYAARTEERRPPLRRRRGLRVVPGHLGNLISHRSMEKVFGADRHSGVAIAGAAGPAVEMVQPFQRRSWNTLRRSRAWASMEGKANQLSLMVPQQSACCPATCRPWCCCSPATTSPVKGHRPVRHHRRALRGERLAAAENGPATAPAQDGLSRRPRAGRGSRPGVSASSRRQTRIAPPVAPTWCADPTMAVITAEGRRRIDEPEVAERFAALVDRLSTPRAPPAWAPPPPWRGGSPVTMPFYVSPEQLMKDRADFARKNIARGRRRCRRLRRRHPAVRREPPVACARSARSTTASPSPAWASTTSSTSCASPASAADLRGSPTAEKTSTPAAWPTTTPRSSGRCSPTSPSPWRWRSSWPRWAPSRRRTGCSTSSTTAR